MASTASNAYERQPYKAIIDYLGNCEIEAGEFLASPLSARSFIDWRSDDALVAWKPAICSDDDAKSEAIVGEIEAAIDKLISGGIVVSRVDAYCWQ